MATAMVVWIKRVLAVITLLVVLVLMVSFITSNTGEVVLGLSGVVTPFSIKVSSLTIVSFILGGLLGVIVSFVSITRLQLKSASLSRKLARRDKEIQKLRSSSLKGLTDA